MLDSTGAVQDWALTFEARAQVLNFSPATSKSFRLVFAAAFFGAALIDVAFRSIICLQVAGPDGEQIPLKPGGAGIPVTDANKAEFARLSVAWKLYRSVAARVDSIREGLLDLVSDRCLRIFSPAEFGVLLGGSAEIDVDEWRRHTVHEGGYSPASPQVVWFWRVVERLPQEERGLLLRFATGSSVPGPGGFARLRGLWGERNFTLVRLPL